MRVILTLIIASAAAATGPWPPAPRDAGPEADLGSPDRDRRLMAILRVGAAAHREGLARLVPFLDDSDDAIRAAAARMLVRAGVAEGIDAATRAASSRHLGRRIEGLVVLREAARLTDDARLAAERALADADAT